MAKTYQKIGWQDGVTLQPAKVIVEGKEYEVEPAVKNGITPVNATNLNHMDDAIKDIYDNELPSLLDVKLIAVADTAPLEFNVGDKYYNAENKKIYTATDNNWGDAETPTSGILYIVFDKQTTYSWNGEDLISVGGGSLNGGSSVTIKRWEGVE